MTLTPLNCQRRRLVDINPGEWVSVHIFYAGDYIPLLTRCVRPLVDKLIADELISRFFFVQHWLEGPHLRLRLFPRFESRDDVGAVVQHDVSAFLRCEPSVLDPRWEIDDELYKARFLAEFSEQQWRSRYGSDGRIVRRDNNTFDYFDYVPETGRYGGERGVEIAEWHAEKSSDLVMQIMTARAMRRNGGTRTALLGIATQLLFTMVYTFLRDAEYTASLFARSCGLAEEPSARASLADSVSSANADCCERGYARIATSLRDRVQRMATAIDEQDWRGLPGFVREWSGHCRQLRDRLLSLGREGVLQNPNTGDVWTVSADSDDEQRLLSYFVRNYAHLTGNRLGMTADAERYVYYVLWRAVIEQFMSCREEA